MKLTLNKAIGNYSQETSDFDTCSYDELTECITARVKAVKEIKAFKKDAMALMLYPSIYNMLRYNMLRICNTIIKLRRMRAILKRSGLHNWNTAKLGKYLKDYEKERK